MKTFNKKVCDHPSEGTLGHGDAKGGRNPRPGGRGPRVAEGRRNPRLGGPKAGG